MPGSTSMFKFKLPALLQHSGEGWHWARARLATLQGEAPDRAWRRPSVLQCTPT